ncbi:MAG TPA: 50S ribosomal protein L3 [Bacillota bacterium]|nr:50S ribosomal protein L3 [Bacillota bacterium]HPF41991.1 50S ribosomal protein L3 [Bacillota bacterium]HPJ85935.1 50S ribosomal protein L3 [Bacillota bacterium]HPQ61829.1 50S ribosomal protein L3 [Bacillota bacterium]
MAKGILGRKVGMTQVFDENGHLVPVTVVVVTPNVVLQKKTVATDGYEAVQLGFMEKRANLVNKPLTGHFAKVNTTPKRYVKEIRLPEMMEYEVGQEVKCDIFAPGDYVDVTGTSKGKGYQGVIVRHNFSTGPMKHGSKYHRGVGSMGSIAANRILKGKAMPGRMGHETVTIQNLQIVRADVENSILLVKGSVPGPDKSLVIVKNATKKQK